MAATTIEYNVRDGRNLAGGLLNGIVCLWDSRTGGAAHSKIEKEFAHRGRVTSLAWIHSKSNSEFYSGSTDGQLYWWDTRKFTEPIDSLLLDPVRTENQEWSRSYGVSVLEFEYTIPTKYMVGSEEGWLFLGNRKGTTPNEKIPGRINCHDGPIRSLERNPIFVKNYMSVGDYRVKIWSDECNDNPVIWTKNHDCNLLCGTWSKSRPSLMLIGRADGYLDIWDILLEMTVPVLSMKISTSPIGHNRAHENGSWVACADTSGDVFILELSPGLSKCSRNEKTALGAMFERESKREKILEGKLRELKLKEKQQDEAMAAAAISAAANVPEGGRAAGSLTSKTSEAAVSLRSHGECEREFYELIKKEQTRRDINQAKLYELAKEKPLSDDEEEEQVATVIPSEKSLDKQPQENTR